MRLVIAEDSTLLRAGLVRLLADEGHDVLAAVGSAPELLEAAALHEPEVIITDVRMPPTHTDDGLQAALEIRRRRPATGVLVLSQYVEKRYATMLLAERSDGVGYVLKDRVAQVDDFLAALNSVAEGSTALDPEVVRQLMTSTQRTDQLGTLTPRERDVLGHMAEGHTNLAIAERLHLSQSSVEKHVNTIFDKLDLDSTSGYNLRVLAILRHLDV